MQKAIRLLRDYDSLLGGMSTDDYDDQLACRIAIGRIEKADQLLKDALCVLNAHAVGHKTQEAIERFLA